MADPVPDWSKVDDEMISTVFDQAETYLEWQFQAALAADQRATTSASIFVGFSVALLVGAVASWADNGDSAVLYGGLITAALLLVGACCCFMAARPRDFYSPGSAPKQWYKVLAHPVAMTLGGQIENYQVRIESNNRVMHSNSEWYTAGAIVSCLAPVVGAIAWLGFSCG